jgi:outer membrane lipoprotein SlyB
MAQIDKRLLPNWGGAMTGVFVGGLSGAYVFGRGIPNPVLGSLLGTVIGAAIGFGIPDLIRLFRHPHKAQ